MRSSSVKVPFLGSCQNQNGPDQELNGAVETGHWRAGLATPAQGYADRGLAELDELDGVKVLDSATNPLGDIKKDVGLH